VTRQKSRQTLAVLTACDGGVLATIMGFLFPSIRYFYELQPEFGADMSLL